MKTEKLQPVVCILNPDDVYYLREREKSNNVENYITPYEAIELQKENVVFPSIRENVVYMLNPMEEKTYIYRTESTDEEIVAQRIAKIEIIVSLLGGKNYKVCSHQQTQANIDTNVNVKTHTDVKAGVDVVANTDIKHTKSTNASQEYESSAQWPGTYTREGYNRARLIAAQSGLLEDPQINSLLIQRSPDNNPNPLINQTYHIHTCSDLARNIDVAAQLNTEVKHKVGVDVDVNVKTSKSVSEEKTFDFEAEFGPLLDTSNSQKQPNPTKLPIWAIFLLSILGAGVVALLLILLL